MESIRQVDALLQSRAYSALTKEHAKQASLALLALIESQFGQKLEFVVYEYCPEDMLYTNFCPVGVSADNVRKQFYVTGMLTIELASLKPPQATLFLFLGNDKLNCSRGGDYFDMQFHYSEKQKKTVWMAIPDPSPKW